MADRAAVLRGAAAAVVLVVALAVALVTAAVTARLTETSVDPGGAGRPPAAGLADSPATVTLALAGDVHFEAHLAARAVDPDATLGAMSRVLADADVAVVNLESALTTEGAPARKELEDPARRYWFRSPPQVLGLLARSGVDAVSMANNHGANYGEAGLRDTLRAARRSPVAVLGVGQDRAEALRPYQVSVDGIEVAVLAADASPRESADAAWDVGETGPGIAAARDPAALLEAVRATGRTADVVVVYLHWGAEGAECPTAGQQRLAAAVTGAGADVVVGTHAHVLQGAGVVGGTYVAYGLGGFHWYHGARPETGVLRLRVDADGRVVDDRLVPARIPASGGPARPVRGEERATAVERWRDLRACTDLGPPPGEADAGAVGPRDGLPAYAATVRPIGPDLRRRMIGASHHPATCPVRLSELRHLTVSYVGFDGRARTGELVVHAEVATDVVGIFRKVYQARWPIRRMRLVDEYAGDDDRSMAADNTSGYNCRRVAGQTGWSEHAYGRAIDLNPVENPYLTGTVVLPPAGRAYARLDRSPGARPGPGVIRRGDVVTRAFAAAGWTWGGGWADPDYQHFSAP